ncbi:MAG TPA: hypothetical protein VHG10_14080 [Glycomyces sp.]|nr:hypothetical protein [Glycomyces sp.]
MGDGGDGGDAADAIAALPVEFPSEAVMAAATGDGGDDIDEFVTGPSGGGGDAGRTREEGDNVIEMTWAAPQEHSGP